MHFIRFLKVPATTTTAPRAKSSPNSTTITISTLISISTDLSESFLKTNVSLRATLRANNASRQLLASKSLVWTSGMRSLPVQLTFTPPKDAPSTGIVCISATENRADDMRTLYANDEDVRILSAWSTPFEILKNGSKADAFVERKLQLSSEKIIRVWEETREDIARHIWPGGLAITSYFSTLPSPPTGTLYKISPMLSKSHLQILELGSGCGLAGIALHAILHSSNITLTDLPITTEITDRNLADLGPMLSSESSIQYKPLDWSEPLPEWCASTIHDLILVADCTYNTASIPYLVNVLAELLKKSPEALVLLAHKVRHDSEGMFFEMAEKEGIARKEHVVFQMAGDTVDLYVLGKI